ncbi:MAG: SLC13 family permease [Candidatus Polarisedimenticolia bacterium]
MSDIAITFSLMAVVVVLFVWNRVPAVIVAIGTAVSLYAVGILDLTESLAGLGDPAVIFIASLFVVSAGLETTGVTAWAGRMVIAWAGKSHTWLLILVMVLVALLTALISINGAVAALLPMVVVMAIRLKRSPSKLLIPLVFAAHAGSLLTLTGTPVNVLVSDAAADAGLGAFGYFGFTAVGVPLLLGSMAIMLLVGHRLLPERSSRTIPPDFSKHARTLIEQYRIDDGVFRLRVRPHSPFVGMAPAGVDLRDYPDLTLVTIQSGEGGALGRLAISEGDILIVRGEARAAASFAADKHLAFRSEVASTDVADALFTARSGLGELMIPPRSGMIGTPVFPGMVTPGGDLVVLAVQRRGEEQPHETLLEAGDTLLIQGTWEALDERLDDPDVLLVDSPEVVRRQAAPMGTGAKLAIAVVTAMVVLIATNLMPAVVAGLGAACLMVLLGALTVTQAYRSINWTTVILVGAMMPLSTAISRTGAGDLLAATLVRLVGDAGPYALVAGLFVLTAILGQMISNTATALIIIPIAIASATGMGVSPRPVLMSVAVAAAASFLTPIATPVNLMVMGPGGYSFGDYWKLGLPLLLWFFVVATFFVPIVWPFTVAG